MKFYIFCKSICIIVCCSVRLWACLWGQLQAVTQRLSQGLAMEQKGEKEAAHRFGQELLGQAQNWPWGLSFAVEGLHWAAAAHLVFEPLYLLPVYSFQWVCRLGQGHHHLLVVQARKPSCFEFFILQWMNLYWGSNVLCTVLGTLWVFVHLLFIITL